MSRNKQIFLTTIFLIFLLILFGLTNIDIIIQDKFFDFSTHQWILNRDLEPYKFIFYDAIKKILILFAVLILFALIFLRRNRIVIAYKKGLIVIVLSAIFIPITIGAENYGKKIKSYS